MTQSFKDLTSAQGMHDLMVCELELQVELCADSLEPKTCFRFIVFLSLCPCPARALPLSLSLSLFEYYYSKINKHWGTWGAQWVM